MSTAATSESFEAPVRPTLSIFPLTSVVLFPKVRVPLFIFEPRYREMIRDEVAGSRTIGMVTIPPQHAPDTPGDPEVFPVGCAGRIEQCRGREDGTFDIVLMGTRRFRIVEEIRPRADQLYRSARVEWLPDESEGYDEEAVTSLRNDVHSATRELIELIAPGQVDTLDSGAIRHLDHPTYINTLSLGLDFSPPERQSLLEAGVLLDRYESVLTLVQFRMAQLRGSMPSDPGSLQ